MQHQQQWTIRNQHQRRRLLFVMKCIAVIYCIIRMGIQYRQHDDYHDSPTTMMSMTNRLEDDGPIEASMTFQQNIPCSSFTRSWLLSVADAFGATPSGAVVETPFQRRRHLHSSDGSILRGGERRMPLLQQQQSYQNRPPSSFIVCRSTVNGEATKEETVASFHAGPTLPTESGNGRVKVNGITVNDNGSSYRLISTVESME